MTIYRSLFALGLTVSVPVLADTNPALSRPPLQAPREGDAAAVKRFFMAGIDRFNRHELDAFMAQFDPDIRMYAVNQWLNGAAALRERFASTFAGFPNVRMEITNLQARRVARNVVTVQFEFHTYPKGAGPAYHGVGSGTYVKGPQGWHEVLEHESVTKRDPGL